MILAIKFGAFAFFEELGFEFEPVDGFAWFVLEERDGGEVAADVVGGISDGEGVYGGLLEAMRDGAVFGFGLWVVL